jgi:hypothetical protein
MKKIILLVGCIVGLWAYASAQSKSDETAIRLVFLQFKTAIQTQAYDDAAALLDSGTVAHHTLLSKRIRNAGVKRLDSMPFFDKFHVLTIRHNSTQAALLQLTRPDVTRMLLRQEWGIKLEDIGTITVTGQQATAVRIANGEATPRYVQYFFKENGTWKISRRSAVEVFEEVHQTAMQRSGQTEKDYLTAIIERNSGKKINPNIWLPPGQWK